MANQCLCGCGGDTGNVYCPGHDAKHVSQTREAIAKLDPNDASSQRRVTDAFSALGSDLLRSHLGKQLENRYGGLLDGFARAGVAVPFTRVDRPGLVRSQ